MRVLVVGSRGREHALVRVLRRSEGVDAVLATRPNPGMATLAEAVDVSPMDIAGVVAAARRGDVGLVIVGPEAPLCAGLADAVRAAGIDCLGPSAAAAQIEGSKAFAKALMDEAGIPTAGWERFTDAATALAWGRGRPRPPVVKGDGLMAGKGVVVPESPAEMEAAVIELMAASESIVLEDRLIGPEVSVIGLTDGVTVLAFPSARDHKRIFDGDRGPNTGGMGAVSPAPGVDDALVERIRQQVLLPAVNVMAARGTPFVGFLYAGVMLTPEGPKVLEFNARLGDPEAQVLLERLSGDVLGLFLAAARGHLAGRTLDVLPGAAVCVVMASAGYPASARSGDVIRGLERAGERAFVAHAGTAARGADVVTNGGRVLGVTARGDSVAEALTRAYGAVDELSFDGAQLRRDIAGGLP